MDWRKWSTVKEIYGLLDKIIPHGKYIHKSTKHKCPPCTSSMVIDCIDNSEIYYLMMDPIVGVHNDSRFENGLKIC